MSILLKSSIFVAGVPKGPTDGTLTYDASFEAELVNRGVANYVGDNPAVGGLVPVRVAGGPDGNRYLTSNGEGVTWLSQYPPKPILRMIVAGHSQAEHHAAVGTNLDRGYSLRGPGCCAALQSGGSLEISSIAGVGSETTTGLLVRLPEIVTRVGEVVFLMTGVNDFSTVNNIPLATTKSNLISIWKMVRDAGKIPIMALLTAVDTATFPTLTSAKANVPLLNAWIVDYARQNPWLLIADCYTKTVDPLTGKMKTAKTTDGLHLSGSGGWDCGPAVLDPLKYILQPRINRVSSNEDSRLVNATSTQALPNPMFIGTTGTLTGTYVAGSVMPTNWTANIVAGAPTVTLSSVPAPSGFGNGVRVEITTAGSAEIRFNPIDNVVNTPVAGEYYQAIVDIDVTTLTGLTGLLYFMRRFVGASSTPVYATEANSSTFPTIAAGRHVLTAPASIIGTGTVALFGTGLNVYFGASGGSCDFVFSRPELRLVTV